MRQIRFVCDKCGEQIGELFGPLSFRVEASSARIDADFCSYKCAEAWVKEDLPQKVVA